MKFPFLFQFLWILFNSNLSTSNDESDNVHFTDSWAVHIENGDDMLASLIARKHGFYNFGQIGSLPGYFHFVRKKRSIRRKRREVDQTVTLLSEEKIKWVEQQRVLEREKRSIVPDYIQVIRPTGYQIQDPLFDDQWYLNNVGQSSGPSGLDINVLPVWARGISGKDVVVAILDDGLDHTHPDLKKNYDEKASYDFNDYDEDPMPRDQDPSNCHGTKCAGEVAAEAGNGICGVGVAFNSSIGGIRMLDGNTTDTIEGSALSFKRDYIDIYSCAWGPKDDGKRFGRPGTLASKALELGCKEGRNGLGSIYVWATGNGGLTDDDCNCDGYTTSVYTISIGAISDHGLSTYYTESCASTLAVTYSGGSHREKKENKIITTTLNHKCTDEFKGTSSAAPLAAGMIALMLEANRNLTWRDVQHIIVETSLMTSPLDEGWRRNGAGKWFNQKFGFGRMDVSAMVEKAQSWRDVAEPRSCWSDKSEGPWSIPSSGTLLVAMNASSCEDTLSEIKTLEHVQVVLSLKHRHRGHLSIELISPSGTRTQLLKTRRNDKSTKGLKDWVFMSVHFWGEDPKGVWTLAVTDNSNNNRDHFKEKNKFGDLEDATEALQNVIEVKDDEKDAEHESIVDADDSFRSSETFENNVFKDDRYHKPKNKEKESKAESETKTETVKTHHSTSKNKASSHKKQPKKAIKKPEKQREREKALPPNLSDEEEKEEEKLVEELLLQAKPNNEQQPDPTPTYTKESGKIPNLNGETTQQKNQNEQISNKPPANQPKNVTQPPSDNSKNLPGEINQQLAQPNEENAMLENVLKTVLSEAFNNFRSESSDYKNFEDRLKGLESALYKHNEKADSMSSTLMKAVKGGKAIDKINNVLGVLENSKNQSKFTNSSFYKNSELVSDVLKVLKDIMSTKKDDKRLKNYKNRISKLLESSSNSTRRLTEKLFNDMEPKADGKEISSSVISDALNLITHIFPRKKKAGLGKKKQGTQKLYELPQDVSILLKGPKGKVLLPYASIQDMITEDKKEQASIGPSSIPMEPIQIKTNDNNIETITIEHTNIEKQPLEHTSNEKQFSNEHKEQLGNALTETKNSTTNTAKEEHKMAIETGAKSSKENRAEGEKQRNQSSDAFEHTYSFHEDETNKHALEDKTSAKNHEESSTSGVHHTPEEENNNNTVDNSEKEYTHGKDHKIGGEHETNVDESANHKLKESEEGQGSYTIAIMKNGKKIGERRVNNDQVSRYLDPRKEANEETTQPEESSRLHGTRQDENEMYDLSDRKSSDDSVDKEEKTESPYVPHRNIGFDVSKFGNEESEEGRSRTRSDDDSGSQDQVDRDSDSSENDHLRRSGKKFEIRVDSDLIPKTISYDLGGDKKHTLTQTHAAKTKVKRKKKHKHKSKQNMYNDQEEEFTLDNPIPFIQIADPNQLAALSSSPISTGSDSDNFVQPFDEPFNSNSMSEFENIPQFEDQASFFSDQRNGFPSPSSHVGTDILSKRSSVNDPLDYMRPDELQRPTEYSTIRTTEHVRSRRSVDEDSNEDKFLLREKRSQILDDVEEEKGPHVVKRSAIFSELYPSKTSSTKRSTIKKVFAKLRTVNGSKRSAIKKAAKLEGALRKKLLDMKGGESSVIDIIKRVHDDISAGNSKDLRNLEKQLSKLENNKDNDKRKVITIKQPFRTDDSAVRTKVAQKPDGKYVPQDPDEYYKYGVSSSGELINFTLRFYGTGP